MERGASNRATPENLSLEGRRQVTSPGERERAREGESARERERARARERERERDSDGDRDRDRDREEETEPGGREQVLQVGGYGTIDLDGHEV